MLRRFTRNCAALAASALLVSGAAHATILTFDDMGLSNFGSISHDYGDRVTGLSDSVGSYGEGGEGFTGNVVVDYGINDPAFWSTGYSGLTNVIYMPGSGVGPLELLFTADAGYDVLLYEFDLGSWSINSTVTAIRVYDQDDTVLYESLGDTVLTSAHTNVAFNGPLSGESLRISIDQTALGGGSDNVGIDNIRFGQQDASAAAPIPEPATMTLLGLGVAAMAARARRKNA